MQFNILKIKILRLFAAILPPPHWRAPVIILIAIFCGLGLHTLHISKAFSYLSDKPNVCMNCHIMATQFATWERGDHGHFSVCNDCHVPQDHLYRKYFFKAADGLRHSTIFTLRLEEQSIQIKQAGADVVNENCWRCHGATVSRVKMPQDEKCWRCHRTTPHGNVNSIAASQFARVPKLEHPVPNWLEKLMLSEKNTEKRLNE